MNACINNTVIAIPPFRREKQSVDKEKERLLRRASSQ